MTRLLFHWKKKMMDGGMEIIKTGPLKTFTNIYL